MARGDVVGTLHVGILRACGAGIRRVSLAFPCEGTHAVVVGRACRVASDGTVNDEGGREVLRGPVAAVLEG